MKNTNTPNFPLAFRDALHFIKGESAPEKLLKVRRFVEWQLRCKHRNLPEAQFQHAVKAAFLARQRQPFRDAKEHAAFATAWLAWWTEIEIPRIRRTNANFLKKPLAPAIESRGNDSDDEYV